jgi:ribonuclease T1
MKGIARLLMLAAVVVLAVGLGWVLSGSPDSPLHPDSPLSPGVSASSTAAPGSAAAGSGLETVPASGLPPEARETLALIARGGPYPHSRDGAVFSNFERLLPREPGGYYKEFTVRTPGESDRGARRIVVGGSGEKYYTPDHYESFLLILEGQ